MKSRSTDWGMRIIVIALIILSFITSSNPVSFWIMPLGVVLIQVYLFLNADIYCGYEKGSPRWKTYRFLTFFGLCFVLVMYYFLYQSQGQSFLIKKQSMLLIFIFMLVFGNLAPKIPYNRNLGLRLPWTLANEDTWRYAHRIAGYASFPCAVIFLCISLLGYYDIAGITILVWVSIPSILSYRYAKKRKEVL